MEVLRDPFTRKTTAAAQPAKRKNRFCDILRPLTSESGLTHGSAGAFIMQLAFLGFFLASILVPSQVKESYRIQVLGRGGSACAKEFRRVKQKQPNGFIKVQELLLPGFHSPG